MHQSIPAAPMPPRANPRALAFFSLGWQIPRGVGTLKLPNASRWGRRKRANAPPPGSYVPNQHCSSFHSLHNNATFSIKCVIFCFCRPASPSSIVCNGTIQGGGIEARPGTEKRCSHNLQSGPVKTWTAVFVIVNISDRRSTYSK